MFTFNASFIDSQYYYNWRKYIHYAVYTFWCAPSSSISPSPFHSLPFSKTLSFEIHHIFNACVVFFWHTIQSRDIVRALLCIRPVSHSLLLSVMVLQLRGSNANYNGAQKNVLYPSFCIIITISDHTLIHTHTRSLARSLFLISFCHFSRHILSLHFIVKKKRSIQSACCCLCKKK